MESEKCLIISGGEAGKINIDESDFDLIIACDHGLDNARALGIRPDVVIGDFDSLSKEGPDSEMEVIRFPKKKDDTDTMLAARLAIERGFKDISICCALGGRADHLIANLQTLKWIAQNKAKAFLIEEKEEMVAFSDSKISVPKKDCFSLSVFSLSDKSKGVSIKGAEYEADNLTLTNSFPIGVSNSFESNEVAIEVKEGTLLVVCSKLND